MSRFEQTKESLEEKQAWSESSPPPPHLPSGGGRLKVGVCSSVTSTQERLWALGPGSNSVSSAHWPVGGQSELVVELEVLVTHLAYETYTINY